MEDERENRGRKERGLEKEDDMIKMKKEGQGGMDKEDKRKRRGRGRRLHATGRKEQRKERKNV